MEIKKITKVICYCEGASAIAQKIFLEGLTIPNIPILICPLKKTMKCPMIYFMHSRKILLKHLGVITDTLLLEILLKFNGSI